MKRYLILAAAVAIAVSACKQDAVNEVPADAADPAPTAASTPATSPPVEQAATAGADATVDPATQARFDGYGDMKLGSTIDEAKTAWAGELNGVAPAEGSTCHYLTPKWASSASEFGFMMEDGKFVRYDVGTAKEAAPGGGKVGMVVEQLKLLYGEALQSAPHKYVEGGKVFTVAASDGSPAKLVFEIDAAGKVSAWRVGVPPQVDYVEGCS